MTSAEGATRRQKPARKANGSGTLTSAIYVDVLREVQRDTVDRLDHLFGPNNEAGTAP